MRGSGKNEKNSIGKPRGKKNIFQISSTRTQNHQIQMRRDTNCKE